jgi:hypothetical protein
MDNIIIQKTKYPTAEQPLDVGLFSLLTVAGVEGDMVYRDAEQWRRLPKGTANQVLAQNAGVTAPEWKTVAAGDFMANGSVSMTGPLVQTYGASVWSLGEDGADPGVLRLSDGAIGTNDVLIYDGVSLTFQTDVNFSATIPTATITTLLVTGQALSADGTVAAPSSSFTSDTNTGRYRIGADIIGDAAGGVLRLRIDTNGIRVDGGTTATTPGIRINDVNTGLFSSGTDEIAVSCGATQISKWTTSGETFSSGKNIIMSGTTPTAALTTITHTDPGTPDYAVQDLTSVVPFGFVTKDEGNSVLKAIANLQIRLAEIETRLQLTP